MISGCHRWVICALLFFATTINYVGIMVLTGVVARLGTSDLAAYGLGTNSVRLLGPYKGQLDNHGERLALEKPLAPDLPGDPMVWVIVDEVIYFDNTPWPADADGTGRALQRIDSVLNGRDPANWYAAWPPTPGVSSALITLAAPEDGTVIFTEQDEPLRALVEGQLVSGNSPQVAFYRNTTLLGTDSTVPYTGTLRPPSAGAYTLRAELTDAAGVWTSRTARVQALALAPPAIVNYVKLVAPEYQLSPALVLADGSASPHAAALGLGPASPRFAATVSVEVEGDVSEPDTARFDFGLVHHGFCWAFPRQGGASIGVGSFIGRHGVDAETVLSQLLPALG